MRLELAGAKRGVRGVVGIVALAVVMLPTAIMGGRQSSLQMPTGPTRTILTDGRVLVVGDAIVLADPNGNVLSQSPLQFPRTGHTSTALPDGKVIVLGGVDQSGKSISQAELIDPNTGTSESVDVQGWAGLYGHTATLINDHQILIVGGISGSGPIDWVSLLDLDTNTMESLGTLPEPRAYATARLLADGRVQVWGGRDTDQPLDTSGVIVDPSTGSVTEVFQQETDANTPSMVNSDPSDNASDVPVDQPLTFRWSRPIRANQSTNASASLAGPAGDVTTTIVTGEDGRLLFVTPTEPLDPGTSYALTLSGVNDSSTNMPTTPVFLNFTTAAGGPSDSSNDEPWNPLQPGQLQEWSTNLPQSPWQRLPSLQALPGVTAVAGQVLRLNGAPLAHVTLEINGEKTITDRTGRFLLTLSKDISGWQDLWIDGRTANKPNRTYGTFEAAVGVTSGKTTTLSFTIWMPQIDTAHQFTITSPTTSETVITTPYIPGLELHLPANAVIKDHDGHIVRQISITPIPLDRPPFPLPAEVDVPIYFTIQPGNAYVEVQGGGDYPVGARLIYPNYRGRPPGTRMNFWHYEPDGGKGWYVYGMGSVSANGRQVIPDPGVSIHEFSGAMVAPPGLAPILWHLLGNPYFGDPVDPGTGLFIMDKTDLALNDVLPLQLQRSYRQNDTVSRAFGIGSSHNYDLFLVGSTNPWTYADLVLADGSRVHYDRISPGTSYTNAVYQDTSSPTILFGSTITWNGAGWTLTTKNGTLITFPDGFYATRPAQAAATRIQDRYGNAIVLTRNSAGDLTTITSPNGRWITLTYDSSHRVTQAQDNINRIVHYTYNAQGCLSTVTDASGGVTTYTYDGNQRMITITDVRGIQYITNTYDSAGRVLTQTQADGTSFQFAYTVNESGQITATDITNPLGYVHHVVYGATGYVSSDTAAVGRPEAATTIYDRDPTTNLLLAVTDPLSRQTTFTYDASGNNIGVVELAGTGSAATTTFAYEPTFNQIVSSTDPLNHTTTFGYDPQGHLTTITDPLSDRTTVTYNAAGQPLTVSNALGEMYTFGYEQGDLESITDSLGRTTSRFIDGAGRVVAVTDPVGRRTMYSYDVLGRVTSETDPLGGQTNFTYDGNGNLLSLTDANDHTTTWTYDTMDRQATRTDALGRTEGYLFDGNGNLVQRTDRKNQITAYTYDGLDRLTQATYSDASTTSYTYDAGDRTVQVADSVAGVITRAFNQFDQIISETTPEGTVAYTYDGAGRRSTLAVTGQPEIVYSYDDADRLIALTQETNVIALTYDAANRRSTITYPNGIQGTYGYDDASQLTSLTYSLGAASVGNLSYTYDLSGNATSSGGTLARVGLPQAVASATYDAANELMTWDEQAFNYDPNGSLISDGVTSYSWNARDQLAGLSGGVSAAFAYDGVGRRRGKTVGGTVTSFLYDNADVIQELSGNTPTANLITGAIDEIFMRTDVNGTVTPLSDSLGSTLELADGSGTLQTHYTFEPFGNTVASGTGSENPSQFTGRENDGTGLYFYRARYYQPQLQRFIGEDPSGFAAGDVNLYAYVGNQPTRMVDPTGLVALYIPPGSWCSPDGRKPGPLLQGLLCSPAALPDVIELPSPILPRGYRPPYFPLRRLPRDDYGNPVPESPYPHTQLGYEPSRTGTPYPQARQFGPDGEWQKDIDFTDHGRDHPDPHEHPVDPNFGKPGKRGPAQPLPGGGGH